MLFQLVFLLEVGTGWVIKLSSTIQRSLSDLEIFDKVLKCLKDLTIYSPMESWITTT